MDVPPGALDAPLQELVDEFVLDPPGLRGLYDFRHQLLRDALYRTIPASDRRRFHARAGEFGARLEGASEIHASVHYERAGLRREAYDAALAGAREAARLSARREAFELYRRAVENMPDDLDPAERAAILTDYAEQAAVDRGARTRLPGRPSDRPSRLSGDRSASRGDRGASRSIGTIARPRGTTAGRAPGDAARAVDGARRSRRRSRCAGSSRTGRAWPRHRGPRCPRRCRRPGGRSTTLRRIGRRSSTIDEWRMVADWKAGAADVIAGDVQGGLARVGDRCLRGRAPGVGRQRRDRVPGSVVGRGVALDYRAAVHWIDEGVRYSDSIEQSHCAHVMRSTLAVVSWAGADPADAQSRARQADRRQGLPARRHGRPLGARLRGDDPGRSRRWRPRELGRRPRPRRVERGDRAHPAAPVGPGRGRSAGRRPGSGVRPVSRRAGQVRRGR